MEHQLTSFTDLNFIFLNEPAKNLIKYLKPLKGLRKIKLSKVNCEEIHELLEVMGEKLTSLEFVCLRESLNLSAIAQSCPNLLSLEVYYSMSVHVASPLNFKFAMLQKLVIYSTDIRGFDTQQVKRLISIYKALCTNGLRCQA